MINVTDDRNAIPDTRTSNARYPPIADIGPAWKRQGMGHDLGKNRWLMLANELAKSGRYRNVVEVEAALKARGADAALPANKLVRGFIDVACYRARRQRGWDT